jgi:type I restriction enzyme S subunit
MILSLDSSTQQHRIVAKVDELMGLCDRLETAQASRERRRDRVAATSLSRVGSHASTDDQLRQTALFYVDRLPRFVTRPEHVLELRETILSIAVAGRLVPQDPRDRPVGYQLAAADAERAATALNDRRATASEQPLLAAEDRWTIPSAWTWRGLADLVLFIDYRGKTPKKAERGVRLVTAKNVRAWIINREPEEFISEDEFGRWMTRGLPKVGDVLFTTEAPMGNASVVRMSERFALAQRVIAFRSYGATDPDYLTLYLLSPQFQQILNQTATGLTAKGIKAAKLKRLPVAVPPLAEQRRIVTKVDQILAAGEVLGRGLTAVQTARARLLDSLLHAALQEEEPTAALAPASAM